MNHEYEQNRASARSAATTHNDTASPGQSSRSALLLKPAHAVASGLIQRKATEPAPGHDAPSIHQIADSGMSGIAGSLPHLETIERSFGSHDVRGIRSFVGGAATAASRELGARAYATGDATVFAAPPDLHTAAHEAAHVIQQRGGVQLKGNMGEVGDRYEQHADAVAELVVQGRSAETLLGQYAGGGGGGGGGGLQLLSDDDKELLATFIDDKIEATDLTVQPKERAAKCAAISAKYPATDKKGLKKAKEEVVAWVVELKRLQAERRAALLAAQAAKKQQAEKPDHKSKEPDDADEDDGSPPAAAAASAPTVKKKKFVPLDLSKLPKAPPTPLTGFSAVAKASASLPDPISAPVAPVSKGPAMIANVKGWKPSSGHDGCNGSMLTTTELQEVVTWAESHPTKYFVKKGTGTGDYSAKNQLKIIHKAVKAGIKQATYHITAKQDALDALSVGDEDF